MGWIFVFIFACIGTILISTIPSGVMSIIWLGVAIFSGATCGLIAGAPLARSLFQNDEYAQSWTLIAVAILGAIVGVLLFKSRHLI